MRSTLDIVPVFSSFFGVEVVESPDGLVTDSFVEVELVLVLAAGLSDLAPAKALPKRLFPPALNLGRVSLPLTAGAEGAGGSEEEGVELDVDDSPVVKPEIRDASEATGWSVSLLVTEV
jgi:hypothetical protein